MQTLDRLRRLAMLSCVVVAGCVQRVDVNVVEVALAEQPEAQQASVRLTLQTQRDIEEIAGATGMNLVEARVYVCDMRERYNFGSDLLPAVSAREREWLYHVLLPRDLSRLPRWEENGEVNYGWDAETTRSHGLCLQLSGGNKGVARLTSPEVRVPDEALELMLQEAASE